MTEIDAVDLGSMFYVGGTQIATEEFLVQAWDGLLWSSVNATGVMYTTRQQITPPRQRLWILRFWATRQLRPIRSYLLSIRTDIQS